MNQNFSLRTPPSAFRPQTGFTLVELLVVITIIGLLAALVVGGAGYATAYSHKVRVQTELKSLETAIYQYKTHKGYFPPDNTNNAAVSTLFYELTGVVPTNSPEQGFTDVNGNFLPGKVMNGLFGTMGINNANTAETPAENFFGTVAKTGRTGTFVILKDPSHTYTLFGVPVSPGAPASLGGQTSAGLCTPWNYVSSNPTNNSAEFDLWVDVSWSGKTNRISNWSPDPQVVH